MVIDLYYTKKRHVYTLYNQTEIYLLKVTFRNSQKKVRNLLFVWGEPLTTQVLAAIEA